MKAFLKSSASWLLTAVYFMGAGIYFVFLGIAVGIKYALDGIKDFNNNKLMK